VRYFFIIVFFFFIVICSLFFCVCFFFFFCCIFLFFFFFCFLIFIFCLFSFFFFFFIFFFFFFFFFSLISLILTFVIYTPFFTTLSNFTICPSFVELNAHPFSPQTFPCCSTDQTLHTHLPPISKVQPPSNTHPPPSPPQTPLSTSAHKKFRPTATSPLLSEGVRWDRFWNPGSLRVPGSFEENHSNPHRPPPPPFGIILNPHPPGKKVFFLVGVFLGFVPHSPPMCIPILPARTRQQQQPSSHSIPPSQRNSFSTEAASSLKTGKAVGTPPPSAALSPLNAPPKPQAPPPPNDLPVPLKCFFKHQAHPPRSLPFL